jgi:hypothetical protein
MRPYKPKSQNEDKSKNKNNNENIIKNRMRTKLAT